MAMEREFGQSTVGILRRHACVKEWIVYLRRCYRGGFIYRRAQTHLNRYHTRRESKYHKSLLCDLTITHSKHSNLSPRPSRADNEVDISSHRCILLRSIVRRQYLACATHGKLPTRHIHHSGHAKTLHKLSCNHIHKNQASSAAWRGRGASGWESCFVCWRGSGCRWGDYKVSVFWRGDTF